MTDYGKATTGYRKLGTSLEPTTADLSDAATPLDRFFVCTAGDAPQVDAESWSLQIAGDAVAKPVTISLEALLSLPQHEQTVWLECAGNGRMLFESVGGQPTATGPEHTQWQLNGMGIASWRGPRLSDVLALAGPQDGAAFVSAVGLDADNPEGEPIRMCLPIDKATADDTLVALAMNGRLLPRSHGAPARLLVPGWVGAYWVKWLDEITVSSTWVPSWRADHYYRHRSPENVIGDPITVHPVKSSLALPLPARLAPGTHEIFGYARSGHAAIAHVEWSLDGGEWSDASLDPSLGPNAWTVFRITVRLDGPEHVIRTRATDAAGNVQPIEQPHHPYGVLWQSIIPHPVAVER